MDKQSGAYSSDINNPLGEKPGVEKDINLTGSGGFQNVFHQKADSEIWKAFKLNHEGAFSHIYNTYFDVLFNYGCQFTKDHGLIEDILQEFFLNLRLKRNQLGEVENIRAYLLKSIRRRVLRQLKKKNRFLVSTDHVEGEFDVSFHQDIQFINAQFTEEQQKKISQLLRNLTPREREIIYHFYFENLDYKGIAQVMGLSGAKTARNLLYKALSSLKRKKHLIPEWLRIILILWV